MDIQAIVFNVQNTALEPRTLAFITDQFHIGQKLHFHRHRAIALTRFTASARHVEREMTRRITAPFRCGRGGKQAADHIKALDIRDRVGSRSASDGSLVNHHHFLNRVRPFHPRTHQAWRIVFQLFAVAVIRAGTTRVQESGLQRFIDHIVNQRRFTRTRYAGHHRQQPQRDGHIDPLQIMQPRPEKTNRLAGVHFPPFLAA